MTPARLKKQSWRSNAQPRSTAKRANRSRSTDLLNLRIRIEVGYLFPPWKPHEFIGGDLKPTRWH